MPIDVLTPTVKRKQITAVFHKQNSAFRKNDSAKPKDSSEMPHSSKPVSAYELVGRIPRLKFDSSKIVQSVLDAIDREMEAHPYEFLVDPSPYEMPREEVELLEHYRMANPGTKAAVRKLLDIADFSGGNEFDDEMPVAAHGDEDATPEELAEDAGMVDND